MDKDTILNNTIKACEENFEGTSPSEDELMELKKWLFSEYARIQDEKAEQQRIYDKFIQERTAFMEDMKRLNTKVLQEQKRLKEDNMFFDKKMQILQSGFMQLDLDRKKFEREKRDFEASRIRYHESSSDHGYGSYSFTAGDISMFFSGVNNPLALRKRYKDLLKIFHPDNMCGDEAIVKAINDEYERLKKQEIS